MRRLLVNSPKGDASDNPASVNASLAIQRAFLIRSIRILQASSKSLEMRFDEESWLEYLWVRFAEVGLRQKRSAMMYIHVPSTHLLHLGRH